MKKGTKKFLFLSVATLAGMYAYNQFVASTSTKKNMLPTKNGSYYSWKQGNVFYTKTGTGDPVLLISCWPLSSDESAAGLTRTRSRSFLRKAGSCRNRYRQSVYIPCSGSNGHGIQR